MHFISLRDHDVKDLLHLMDATDEIKAHSEAYADRLKNKTLAMIFLKHSTRTRISFEVAMTQLGGQAIFMSPENTQIGRGETIADTIRVLSRYVDAIMARVFAYDQILEIAKYSRVPVINGLTDLDHPCQVLSDLVTIREKKGQLKGLNLTFVGNPQNNICHSFLQVIGRLGLNFTICCPPNSKLNEEIFSAALQDAKQNGTRISIVEDPKLSVKEADVIYTDVWVSMHEEDIKAQLIKRFSPYQINKELMEASKPDSIIMHCMPIHRGQEMTDEVADSQRSVIIAQAENRLHTQKAILLMLLDQRR